MKSTPVLRTTFILLCCLLTGLIAGPPASADTSVGGTISTDTTWTLAGSPYIVTSTVKIQGTDGADGITTLTIEPGVELRFAPYTQMIIGSGSPAYAGALVAQGTASQPIVFTSNQATPAPGDWGYIRFYDYTDDATTVMEHCVVEYAGYSYGALYIDKASPTIKNTTIRNCKNAGLYLSNSSVNLIDSTVENCTTYGIYMPTASPVITNTTFSNNGNYDIYFNGTAGGTITGCTINNGIYMASEANDGITGCTINYTSSYPIRLGAQVVGQLLADNTINNLDSQSYLEVVADTITSDATWTASLKYHVLGAVKVQGTDGADGITTLTIEPGVELRFAPYTQMLVGGGSPAYAGALVAQGTASQPIVFTSNQATPAPGDWGYIRFYDYTDDATTVMEHCVVEYAGYSYGAMYIDKASPTIKNTTIRNCKNAGLYVSDSSLSLIDSTIENCTTYGIYLPTGSPVITNTTFSNNGNYDIYFNGTPGGTITGCSINNGIYMASEANDGISGCTINYNSSYPIRLGAQGVGQLLADNTINNLDSQSYMEVTYDTITTDATWNAALKYHVLGNIAVKGKDGDDAITTLSIEPGVELRFAPNTQMTVGSGSTLYPGALVAQGTDAQPILFTSNKATPAPGDWRYIRFYDYTDDNTSMMEHCVVEYAGSSYGALYIDKASPTIKNSTIRNCKNTGIYAAGAGCSNTQINCNTFTQNDKGIYWTANSPPEMHQNNFNGNTGYALHYTGADTLNAEDNWWNTTQGPNAGGDTFSGNVDADPWSSSENVCTGEEPNQPPNTPSTPTPADGAVRVSVDNGVALSWTGGDPNLLDIVTYDLYWGTAPDALSLEASDLTQNTYTKDPVTAGLTFYWQIIAKDDKGEQTAGPVWHFTAAGDPPDLIISGLTTDPAGNISSGQGVTLTATVENAGSGPAVDAFDVDFAIDGASIGAAPVNSVMLAGDTLTFSQTWTYNGADPTITITADSAAAVSETDEQNNAYTALLSEAADNTAPALVGSSPSDGAYLQQVQNITATLADSQSTVDDAAVMASFSVVDGASSAVAGTVGESGDTFTFVPTSLPLADSVYTVSLTAADTYGNSQNVQFAFTIDTTPPAKPVITGGTVTSGTIQPRPAQNTTGQFRVDLTGTREAGTSVWINGVERVAAGDDDWSVPVVLQPGDNAIEVWLEDLAGNIGPSEWVDIHVDTGTGVNFEYDASGRVRRITNEQ